MFEKQSHVHTSVSWGGFGAVWEQTPRQTKETDSSFATTCTLAEQAGPHQNRRALQIFIISPLLTSLLIFPWNKRNHKSSFFFFPYPSTRSSPWEETKTCSGLILSGPGNWPLAFLFSSWGISSQHSEAMPFLSPSPPHWNAHTPFGDGQLSSPASAPKGRTWGNFRDTPGTCNSAGPWKTPRRSFSLPLLPSTLHHLPGRT